MPKSIKIILLITFWNLLSCQTSETPIPQPTESVNYICYQTSESLIIDGKDSEIIWQNAPWTSDFIDIEGKSKAKPKHRTRAKMLWDKDSFYFFAKLEEPHIWATLTERDAVIYHDDDFEIFMDPNGDGHNYYEFEINAFNTLWDLFLLHPYYLKKHPNYLFNWTIPDIKTAVHIEGSINNPNDEDQFWSAEFAIPWDALKELSGRRRLPRSGDQWRINFSRVDWEMDIEDGQYIKRKHAVTGKELPENNWVWTPTGIIDMHRPERWGYVQFSEKIAGEGEDIFIENPDERIKKALWDLYNQQHQFYKKNGRYSDDLSLFTIPKVEGCEFNPAIFVTPNLFEIITQSCKGNRKWRIQQDGKIGIGDKF